MFKNEKVKNIAHFIVPSIITLVILGSIFLLNNLYPFGNNPIVQVDSDYLYIPSLYKLYDLLHHGGSIFYNGVGLGSSIYGSLIIQRCLFSPLNLLLYFVSRDNLINFFGTFIIIKLCLLSLTSYIYINNKYNKLDYFYKVVFSILYTFNGFIIFNYFNEIWLELVILFPLLVMYLDKILDNKNSLGYIIVLASCLILNAYFSMFIVVFIILYSAINIYLFNKKEIKKIIFKLGKSTLIALLISAFSTVPLMYQILRSDRFNGNVYTDLFSNLSMKSLYILMMPILIVFFIKLMFKYKEDKTNITKYGVLVGLYLLPVIIDPINSLMHGGTYWSFPYRYGFVTAFILMDASLYYLTKYNDKKDYLLNIKDIIISIIILWLGVFGYYMNNKYRSQIINSGIFLEIENSIYVYTIYIVIIVLLMSILIFIIKNKGLKKLSLALLSIYSIAMFTTWTIYYNSGYYLCITAQNAYSDMYIPKDGRYKIEYHNHTPYFGYIFKVDALDNWLHIVPQGYKEVYSRLGYHVSGTSVYSSGGTMFSDWLLNIKYGLSKQERSTDDYITYVSGHNDIMLYKYNYGDNYGIIFDDYDEELSNNTYANPFNYQNKVYKNFTNSEENIINIKNYNYNSSSEIKFNYEIKKKGYLYFYNYDTSEDSQIDYITVNNIPIYDFNNYIKFLGIYHQSVNIEIHLKEYSDDINFSIGFLESDKLSKLSSSVTYKKNKYYVNADSEDKNLFLPINNIKGIHVYNNDKEVETFKCLDNFICLKLNKGENVISIKYKQPLFNMSIIISLIGLVLLILNNKIKENKLLLNICFWSYNILVMLVIIYYYFYSLFKY